jgi:hypothetical protein
MIRRIAYIAAAAATLWTAAPAFAADGAPAGEANRHHVKIEQPCSCCSDGSMHEVDHPMRGAQKQKAAPSKSDADEVAAGNSQGRG